MFKWNFYHKSDFKSLWSCR